MNRRGFLRTIGGLAALKAGPALASANQDDNLKTTSDRPPRKVIIGTAMQSFWGAYPGLSLRLEQLAEMLDQMAAQAKEKYGRSLDLAVLPEAAITGEAGDDGLARSVAGFRYYEDEDCGIFWSNDPKTTIGEMVRAIGLLELEDEMARVRKFYRRTKAFGSHR